jgi:PAS domain S-box-containing protein
MIDHKNIEPANAFMIVDIISKVLSASDDIDKLSEWLIGEIREITGARLVLIVSKTEQTKQFKILHVSPKRKRELCTSDEISRLIFKSFLFKEITELSTDNENISIKGDLQKLNFEINLAIPLVANNETFGSLLVLGLPDKNNLEMLKNTYGSLAALLGLVFRNAHLIDYQENIIQERTKEIVEKQKALQEQNFNLENAINQAEESKNHTKEILQTAIDGFWLVDLKGKFIDVNDVACKMVGYTRREMLKLGIFDLEIVETAEQIQKHIQKIFEIGEDRFETKHRCSNGETIDVELSVKYQSKQNLFVVFVRDITERAQNENKMADLVERLTLSLEVSKAGTWDWDIPNGTSYWSDEFLKIFGMEPDTVPGFESWTKSIHPDDIETASKSVQDAIDEKTDLLSDYRILLPDGTLRWIRSTGKVTYENEIPKRMIGLCIDFTDQKRAEEALDESEKKFRSLFETMSEGIVYEDHDGNIISANPAAERLLGLSLKQLQGRTSFDPRWKAIHEDGSPFPGENHSINVAAKTGKPTIGEIMGIYNPKLDSYVWLSVNATPEFLPGEKMPFRAYAVFRDISERKKAEDTLRSSEERYRLLFQNHTAGFALHEIILNAECQPCDYRFLEINPAFETLTGLKAKDIIGKTELEVLPNSEPYWIETYGEVALKGKSINFENYSKELNKHFQVSAYSPEPGKFATVFLDITERKDAEQKILESQAQLSKSLEMSNQSRLTLLSVLEDQRKAEKEIQKLNAELEQKVSERTLQLEAAIKELEAFSYSVSHDLRSPLRHINGFAEILTKQYSDQIPEDARKHLNTIIGAVKKMSNLIDDLLSFSRTGRAEMKKSSLKMNLVVDDALAQVQPSLTDREIDWKIAPLPEIFGDYNLLRQVWVNLLDNAVKYTRTRKKAAISIGYKEEEKELIFYIKDNGVGFDMKYSDKLFGVFQRLHSFSQFEGTGIGLANVQRIILRHGGRVWAEAETDKGAAFYFSIPK